MELIQISLPCGSFYNPGTGEFIADTLDGVNPSSKSIKGSWNHEIIDQPDFFDDALAGAWDSWYEKLLNAEEDCSEESFMYIDYEKMLEKISNRI